jgi:thiol-disulfide isomerase/thioredoxin
MKFTIIIIFCVLFLVSCGKKDEQLPLDEPEAGNPIIDEPESIASPYFALPYEFTATDLYGNIVTNETLGEKQVFFVHLWATWCGPCVRGMPDLAVIAQNYADSVGFIGLVSDFDDNAGGAIRIIESAGVPSSFVMLNAAEPSLSHLREMVRTGFVPASMLITKDNLSPEPLDDRDYTKHLDEALS